MQPLHQSFSHGLTLFAKGAVIPSSSSLFPYGPLYTQCHTGSSMAFVHVAYVIRQFHSACSPHWYSKCFLAPSSPLTYLSQGFNHRSGESSIMYSPTVRKKQRLMGSPCGTCVRDHFFNEISLKQAYSASDKAISIICLNVFCRSSADVISWVTM